MSVYRSPLHGPLREKPKARPYRSHQWLTKPPAARALQYRVEALRPRHRFWKELYKSDDLDRALAEAVKLARVSPALTVRVWDFHGMKEVWRGKGAEAKVERWEKARPKGMVGKNKRGGSAAAACKALGLKPGSVKFEKCVARSRSARANPLTEVEADRILRDAECHYCRALLYLKSGCFRPAAVQIGMALAHAQDIICYAEKEKSQLRAKLFYQKACKLAKILQAQGVTVTGPQRQVHKVVRHALPVNSKKAAARHNPGSKSVRTYRVPAGCEKAVARALRDSFIWAKAHEGSVSTLARPSVMKKVIQSVCKRGGVTKRRRSADNPRKVHERIVRSFLDGRSDRIGKRYWTDGRLLRVWGNLVAEKVNGGVRLRDAGYQTLLTKNVLNELLWALGAGKIQQKAHEWYIVHRGESVPWTGEVTIRRDYAVTRNPGRRRKRRQHSRNGHAGLTGLMSNAEAKKLARFA